MEHENHRKRLIAAGLYTPMPPESEYKRSAELYAIQQGEWVEDRPIWCVYRRDDPHRYVIQEAEDHECQTAELIADKLYSWEAPRIADRLNFHDPEQPRAREYLPPVGMYAICTMETWAAWEQRRNQTTLEGMG